MARATKTFCLYCEAKIDADVAFCPHCDKPTEAATHDERVAWEVRQWRDARSNGAPAPVHASPPPSPRKPRSPDVVAAKPSSRGRTRLFGRRRHGERADARAAAPAPADDLRVTRNEAAPVEQAAPKASPPAPATPASNGSAAPASNGSVAERRVAHLSQWERDAIARRARISENGAPPASPTTNGASMNGVAAAETSPSTDKAPSKKATAKKPAAKKAASKKAAAKKPAAKKAAKKKTTSKKTTAKKTKAATAPAQEPATAREPRRDEALLAESVEILRSIGSRMATLDQRLANLEQRLEPPSKRRLFRRR